MILEAQAPSHIQLPEQKLISPEPLRNVEAPAKTMRGRLLGRIGLKKAVGAEVIDRSAYVEGVMQSLYERGGHPGAEEREVLGSVEVYDDDFIALGYEPLQANRSDKEGAFHKDNDPGLDDLKREGRDWYRVVEDEAGSEWFLKTQNKHPRYDTGLTLLHHVRSQQKEFYAHAFGESIGYPVTIARRVIHDGKPWLAYPYIDNHISVDSHDATLVDKLGLPYDPAYKTRPVFNALLGSSGDGAVQAIIDPASKQYLAQDIMLDTKDFTEQHDYATYYNKVLHIPKDHNTTFDTLPRLNEDDKAYARAFLDKTMALTETEAMRIFANGVNEFSDPKNVLATIQKRAEALLFLIDRM